MARKIAGPVLAAILVLSFPAFGQAFGWRHGHSTYYSPAVVYYPAYYVVPVVPVYCPPVVVKPVPVPIYAIPKPAPPSSTAEPPLGKTEKRPPIIMDSNSLGGNYPPMAADSPDLVPVGFWNITGRDVVVIVGGRSHTLRRNQTLSLRLERRFIYQVDNQEPKNAQVPAERKSLEIVLR